MSDIFIGYLREDMAEAGMLANALEQGGWTVCWDSKLQEGASFAEVVEKALLEAKCVVVLWSAKSVQSGFLEDLATFAFNRRMLVSVAIEDVNPPSRFAKVAVQRLIEWDGSKDCPEFGRLVEAISALVPPSATAQAKPVEKCDQNSSPTVEAGNVFTDILQDGSIGPEMVVIPEDSFEMGDHWGDGTENEKPVHTVRIEKPFALGKFPVMFCEYDKFAEATGHKLPSDARWGRIRRPVINVSWEDAVAYIDWLSQQTGKRYRLPSEAEWEYAARSGGKDEKWAGTNSLTSLDAYAWYGQNSSQMTYPVGSKKPNGLGLYDMSGNVWEWVQDFWHESYEGAPTDGSVWEKGDSEGHVVRGGSWRDWPDYLRVAHRYWGLPDFRYFVIGFRIARDL